MNKSLLAAAALSAILLTSCAPATTPTTGNSNGSSSATGVSMSSASSTANVAGNPQSSVVLMEFSDLQCPACKTADPSVKSILSEFGTQIRFEYRHFPLSMHRHAKVASYAAEAAAKQGKFWEMKDKLFETQSEWQDTPESMQLFVTYAQELGLDTDKFERDAMSDEVKAIVERDLKLGNEMGVNATPTFYLNGKRLRPNNFNEFSSLVREAVLNEKQ